jgi:hypothetical protein
MIKANTVMKSSTNGNMKLDGSVLIDVPKQLKPAAKMVLTHELAEILKAMDKIDPDINTDALKILIEEVQNEQD